MNLNFKGVAKTPEEIKRRDERNAFRDKKAAGNTDRRYKKKSAKAPSLRMNSSNMNMKWQHGHFHF